MFITERCITLNKLTLMYFVLSCRYASSYGNAYGADGYHSYMRNQDPTYDAFYAEGPSVDDKWRSTYPYVPTSYLHQTQGR